MTYREWKDAKQEEFNKLPIFFAFSDRQFKKEMEKRGLTENDTDKIYGIGNGGFYLRSDAEVIRDWFSKPDELPELMKDHDFAVDAFRYEMGEHEYHINWQGDWDVCQCFGECDYAGSKTFKNYLEEAGYSDEVVEFFKEAKRKFYKDCDDNDWW